MRQTRFHGGKAPRCWASALAAITLLTSSGAFAQTPADSVTMTFRTNQAPGLNVFVPGQFNNWGPNSSGVISPGAPSQMTYNATYSAYLKSYQFKIHSPGDPNRTLGDSVYLYKFNSGGCQGCWYSDPLNPEINAGDPNNNSVLRLTKLFWFEYYPTVAGDQLSRITAGLVHANSDSITVIRLSTGITEQSPLTSVEITSSYNRALRILDHTLAAPVGKLAFVRLVAYNNRGDSVVFKAGGIVVPSAPLPSYAKHGVTLPSTASGDSVTFRLRVPGRSYVQLRLTTAGQNPALAAPLLMRDGGGGNWWLNVKLTGGDYEYLYELDGGTKVYDPWGRWNGTLGSRFTVGAAGLTADDYVWTSDSYVRPPLNKTVIYEMNLGEVTGGFYGLAAGQGTFDHLKSLLTYFDTLGVTAIELMPVNDYGSVGQSGFSWGYDVNSYFALEPGYGTPRDFKELVDSAHALGIAIIADVVFNHLNDTSPLWQMLPDEIANPYFKPGTQQCYNEDGLLFFKDMDHCSAETQELVYEVLKMWIDEYRVDGFRYDYTQGIGWNPATPTTGILGWANRIEAEYGGAIYQIAEHLPESPALLYYSGINGGWHDSFHDELFNEAYDFGSSLNNLQNIVVGLGAYGGNDTPSSPSSYANRTEPVNMTGNHDEQSLIHMMTYESRFVYPDSIILRRDKLYGSLMFTSLGIPMLWQGVEFSAPRGWLQLGDRLSYRPLEVEYLSQERGQSHYNYYRTLIRQRLKNPALTDGTYRVLKQFVSSEALAWGFEDPASGAKVMVVANFLWSDANLTNLPWMGPGTWYDVFDQSTVVITDTLLPSYSIAAFTAHIYSNKSDLELGIVTSVRPPESEVPASFALGQNYPNPFNPSTTISYSLAADGVARVEVFNLLGEKIAVLADGFKARGIHTVSWNGVTSWGAAAGSGVYLIRLQSAGLSQTRKIVLLR